MTISVAGAANLEQLRKRARELQRAHRAGQDEARQRVAALHPRPSEPLKLTEAQLVLARENGFPSWPKLRAYLRRLELHGAELRHPYHADTGYYAERALGLLASVQDGTPSAVAAFTRWNRPETPAGARAVVAGEHGFSSWRALSEHVRALPESGEPFARAYRAVEAQDPDALRGLLELFPELPHARGTNGNDLLGMAGATCDERLVRLLLEHGADPASANAHGWTPLHQAGYSGLPRLAELLLAAGAPADVSARGDGGTPLVVALFWGHRETAELLAGHGLAPGNLRVAAGLGRLDMLADLLATDGTLAPAAGAHRSFYRPHSGFGRWQPSADPDEIRNEALSWAARNDRAEAVRMLVRRGADPDAEVHRGTALTWAASTGKVRAVRELLALGADPDRRGGFGGPEHGRGVTALHLAAQNGRLEVITTLLAAGADPTVADELYQGTPQGWALHGDQPEAAELLRAAETRAG